MSKIALLNDAFRRTFSGGKVTMTAAVDALPADVKATVLQKMRSFNEFGADNDPHGEHDFGSFKSDGETFFFKIDGTRQNPSSSRSFSTWQGVISQ